MNNNATITDSQALLDTYFGFEVSQLCMISIIAFFSPLEVWGFIEYLFASRPKSHKSNTRIVKRLRISLMLNGFFTIVVESIVVVVTQIKDVSPPLCDFMAKAIAIIYLFGLVSGYLFLLQKVRLVSKFEHTKFYRNLLWGMEIALAMMAPTCFILYGIVTTGRTTAEGRCMQRFEQWTFWVFSVGNFALSSTLVYLFVTPLKKMADSEFSTTSKAFRRVYRKNVFFSVFSVLFTFAVVFTYGILHFLAEEWGMDEYNVIGLLIMSWDSFVLAACCRLTTNVWLPSIVQKVACSPEVVTSQNGVTSGDSKIRSNDSAKVQQQVGVAPVGEMVRVVSSSASQQHDSKA